jgi:hypothetical protein
VAIVVTTPEALIEAARDRLVNAGVVADAFAFAVDDADELTELGGLVEDRAAAVWLREVSQDPPDVSTEPPDDEIPIAGGLLVVSAFVRHDQDQAGRADAAIADQTDGISAFCRRIVRALNDEDLEDGADTLTMESLTFRRWVNRGKVKGKGNERWRRWDVSFDLLFRWDLDPADEPDMLLAEAGEGIEAESGVLMAAEG